MAKSIGEMTPKEFKGLFFLLSVLALSLYYFVCLMELIEEVFLAGLGAHRVL